MRMTVRLQAARTIANMTREKINELRELLVQL